MRARRRGRQAWSCVQGCSRVRFGHDGKCRFGRATGASPSGRPGRHHGSLRSPAAPRRDAEHPLSFISPRQEKSKGDLPPPSAWLLPQTSTARSSHLASATLTTVRCADRKVVVSVGPCAHGWQQLAVLRSSPPRTKPTLTLARSRPRTASTMGDRVRVNRLGKILPGTRRGLWKYRYSSTTPGSGSVRDAGVSRNRVEPSSKAVALGGWPEASLRCRKGVDSLYSGEYPA